MAASTRQWLFTRWTTVNQLEALDIHHPDFKARLFLQGAHLTSFAPTNEPDWLWESQHARYETGRAIRGGVPVCWPWFGVADKNPPEVTKLIVTDQAHGFARTAVWKLEQVSESSDFVEVSLSLNATSDFVSHWQGQALALITFIFSAKRLQIGLTTTNLGAEPLAFSQALHSYLPTSDILSTELLGLDNKDYTDTLDNWRTHQQAGNVTFDGETDRIYQSGDPIIVVSPDSRLKLSATGSDSAVVWNPGPAKARELSDFHPMEWKTMLCVETANAFKDYQVLNTGQSHTLGAMLEKLSGNDRKR